MMPASDQVERSTSTIRAFRALARYSSCASACGTAGRSSDTNPVYPMHARPTCFSHLDNHIARFKRSARLGESRRRQDKSKHTNNPFDHRFLLSERYSTLLETGDTCRSQAGLIWINPSCGLESRGRWQCQMVLKWMWADLIQSVKTHAAKPHRTTSHAIESQKNKLLLFNEQEPRVALPSR